jgi:hypothetical protein
MGNNIDIIYNKIHETLDEYLDLGIRNEHLINYLNTDEENYKFVYSKIYKKLTIENIQFTSEDLHKYLKDVIVDKIRMYNDITNK